MKSQLEHFYEENLVCPQTHEALTFSNGSFVTPGGKTFNFENQVPCFLDSKVLTEHQKSELDSAKGYIEAILNNADPHYSIEKPFAQPEFCWKWCEKWLNPDTGTSDKRIVCIGGAFADDLPQVKSCYKFNIDHLAHEYVKLSSKILEANTHHIACVSEKMPFSDNYADFVYSRNSLDHVCNPVQTLKEIHRILKPQGKFLLRVYYDSNIINEHESTSIDDEFVNRCIEPLFAIEYKSITSHKNKEILLVGQKKAEGNIQFTDQEITAVGQMLSFFHPALYFDKRGDFPEAAKNYAAVLKTQPVFKTDLARMFYSLVRFYGITDHFRFNALDQIFKTLFGANSNSYKVFEKTITDFNIQPNNDIIGYNLSNCIRALDEPGFMEGKQILRFFAKLGDAYLDKTSAKNVHKITANTAC